MANRFSSFIEIEAGSRMIVRNDITKVKADVIVNTEYESGAGIYHGTSSKFFKRSRDIRQSMLDAYPFLQNMYSADDGKQTPMRGHPVFIAQHATATCCRECIRKWHKMQPGKELSQVQQEYLVDVIMTWIQKEMERH